MTTTDHHPAASGLTIDLGAIRDRRARMLLDRRDELGTKWAEALSHDALEADDLAYDIAVVENAISQNHPAVFDQHFSGWVARDAAQLHSPGAARGSCIRCDAAHGNAGAA